MPHLRPVTLCILSIFVGCWMSYNTLKLNRISSVLEIVIMTDKGDNNFSSRSEDQDARHSFLAQEDDQSTCMLANWITISLSASQRLIRYHQKMPEVKQMEKNLMRKGNRGRRINSKKRAKLRMMVWYTAFYE